MYAHSRWVSARWSRVGFWLLQAVVGVVGSLAVLGLQLRFPNFAAPFLPLYCYTLLSCWVFEVVPSLIIIACNMLLTNYWLVQPLYAVSFRGAAGATSLTFIALALCSLRFFVAIVRNARLQESSLRKANEIASKNASLAAARKEAVLMRDSFVATAGHELRTPLTHLYLCAQKHVRRLSGGKQAPSPEAMLHAWQEQQSCIERIVRLVEQLLDVARVDSQQLALTPQSFDVGELMHDIERRFATQAASTGCALLFTGQLDRPWVWDRDRFDQLVANLLTNAFKYAPGAPVVVHWRFEQETLLLSVCDHGPGVATAARGKIFERFERLDAAAGGVAGLGLGLWICRQIVERAGGTLELQESGLGCRFLLRLPALAAAAPKPAATAQRLTLVADA